MGGNHARPVEDSPSGGDRCSCGASRIFGRLSDCCFLGQTGAPATFAFAGTWNCNDYRPLDGFVYAVTPFNFTSIAANLPSAPALAGNTVLWKPASTAKYAAHFVMEILRKAGLPPGVINLVYVATRPLNIRYESVLAHRQLAGVHFTGSTNVFNTIVQRVGQGGYRSYPRVVGETGGKNFILAHPSADLDALVTAIIRGGFEYQGQKCSAASRVYVPKSLWPAVRERLVAGIESIGNGRNRGFPQFHGGGHRRELMAQAL